jgi:hypothetical protein
MLSSAQGIFLCLSAGSWNPPIRQIWYVTVMRALEPPYTMTSICT